MKLPPLDDVIGKQRDVYLHPADESLFIAGPPGSGKTTLAVYRAQYLANQGRSVALVTKNRMLVALAHDLGGAVVCATTMHKLVAGHYSQRFKRSAPQIEPYVFNWEQLVSDYDTGGGFGPTLDHMVIDEGQNLPAGFFRWARHHGARTLTVFADEDQGIDNNRCSLGDICEATGLLDPERLTMNYRNTMEIAAVAEHFHVSTLLPPALVHKGPGGDPPRLLRLPSRDHFVTQVVTRFRNRNEAIGVIVWRKADAIEIHRALRNALPPPSRVDVYTSDSPAGAELDIHLFEPGVTVLTGESVIGLEFDAVYLLDLARSLPCTTPVDWRRMYMLCARARNALVLVDEPTYLSAPQLAALPNPPILAR